MNGQRHGLWIIALIMALSVGARLIWTEPVISEITTISFPKSADWDLHLSWGEATRQSLMRFGQLPLWNPYRCGGAPLLGEPESDIASLYLPFLLLFGPGYGYIGIFFFYWCIGMYGFYLLSRYHGISRLGGLLTGLVYMCSGLFTIPFAVGATNFLAIAYLPFIFVFTHLWFDSKRLVYAFASAFFMALMFLSGFHYILIVALCLCILTLIRIVRQRNIASGIKLVYIFVLFAAFSAIKLFPTLESLWHHPFFHRPNTLSGYSLKSLFLSWLSRDQTPEVIASWGGGVSGFIHGVSYGIHENGMYVGLIALTLCIIGYIYGKRKLREYAILFIVFILFAFGNSITPSIYTILHKVPLFSYMEVAQRYRYIFMVPFVLFVGMGFDVIAGFLYRKYRKHATRVMRLLAIGVFCVVIDLAWVNTRIFYDGFRVKAMSVQKYQPFSQICREDRDTNLNQEYPLVAQGFGMRNCVENVLIARNAVCHSDPLYNGEIYMTEVGATIDTVTITPNVIRARVHTRKQGLVVINQNYDPGWWVVVNNVIRRPSRENGLLSAAVGSGTSTVIFFYFPLSFILGAFITGMTACAAWRVIVRSKT